MDPKFYSSIAITAVVLFAVYLRIRRNIGRQPLRPVRMQWRIGLFGIIGAVFLIGALRDVNLLAAIVGGIAAGALLGWFGLRHTKFEVTPEGTFYTPHTYIGMFVSALFLGRILYRFLVLYPGMQAAAQGGADDFASYQKSPLTLLIFGVLVGYYITYYAGVLIEARKLHSTTGASVS